MSTRQPNENVEQWAKRTSLEPSYSTGALVALPNESKDEYTVGRLTAVTRADRGFIAHLRFEYFHGPSPYAWSYTIQPHDGSAARIIPESHLHDVRVVDLSNDASLRIALIIPESTRGHTITRPNIEELAFVAPRAEAHQKRDTLALDQSLPSRDVSKAVSRKETQEITSGGFGFDL